MPQGDPAEFLTAGWCRFPIDPKVVHWVRHALPAARAAVEDPANAHWYVCEGTWFVGVDALPNDPTGAIGSSGPLTGQAVEFVCKHLGYWPPLHRAQVSVAYPGYPKPREGESAGAFRYRLNRDAAHVDGLLAEGPERRRYVREPHAFILGLPLVRSDPGAAPLVVYSGSHVVMRAAFQTAFSALPAAQWGDVDVTSLYNQARKDAFQTCARLEVPVQPGEVVLLHRLTLHGVAPWAARDQDRQQGRMIAYFRPQIPGGVSPWIEFP